jgi:hypothetical protein
LVESLNVDIGWIRQHAEVGEQARRWALAKRPGSLLLRSPAPEQAERWIASRPPGAPVPTEETKAFVTEGRRSAIQRRNILTASLAIGLLVALAFAGVAYWQRGLAIEQRRIADQQREAAEEQRKSAEEQRGIANEQRDVAERRRTAILAETATGERLRGKLDSALRLSVHAARIDLSIDHSASSASPARSGLAAAVLQSNWRLTMSGHKGGVTSAAFSPDGKR